MYDLFTNTRKLYSGLISDFVLNNISRRTIEDVDRVIQYYRDGSFSTRNDHILARLINTVGTPLSYDLDYYYEVTIARSLYAANSLKLTSSISAGQWHVGNFYYNCPEIVIAYNGNDNPHELAKNWKELQPVKVLEAPVSNMRYLLPDGNNNSSERGLVVIGVDLAMLMVQYKCFMDIQAERSFSGEDSILTTKHFVAKYVLPNMVKSQTDIALFNRMYNLEMGGPMGEVYKRHPFYITNYTTQLDKNLLIFIERLRNSRRDYDNYIDQIPSFFSDRFLAMPDTAETRQVWWALFLARKKAMEFLIELGGEEGKQFNRMWLNKLKVDAKGFINDKIYERVLPEAMKQDMRYFLKNAVELK